MYKLSQKKRAFPSKQYPKIFCL